MNINRKQNHIFNLKIKVIKVYRVPHCLPQERASNQYRVVGDGRLMSKSRTQQPPEQQHIHYVYTHTHTHRR